MTIPPPVLLGISILAIVIGIISMPWLQEISLILIIIGAVVSIYAVAGLIGMAFRKKAPYLEADIKDTKHLPGVWLLVVGFFAFFAFFRVFSDQLPENLVAPIFFAGLGGLFILGLFALVLAKKRWKRKGETPSQDSAHAPPPSRMKQGYWALIIVGGVAFVFLGIIYINSRSSDVTEWTLFESEKYGFEVLFPSSPDETIEAGFLTAQDSNEQLRYRRSVYSSRKPEQDRSYAVNVIEYPLSLRDESDEILLEQFLNELVSRSSANKLEFSEPTKLGDYNALDFHYTYQGSFHTCGKIIAAQQVLYQLSVNYGKQFCSSAKEFKDFIKSFRLTASSWTVYRNEKMGFELRHPDDFRVDEFENSIVVYKGEKLQVAADSPIDPYGRSFAIAIYSRGENCGDCNLFDLERSDIGSYYTQKAVTTNSLTTYFWIYADFAKPSQKVFRINVSFPSIEEKTPENERALNQILSTLLVAN